MSGANKDVEFAVMINDIKHIKTSIDKIENKLESDFITRAEFEAKFEPIKKVVYGLVGLILVGVVSAVLTLVIKT